MFENDLKIRVQRVLSGTSSSNDLDRIYLGLRRRAHKKDCFREIGDFVAHRDIREKGLVTQVGRDVFTSLEVWSLGLRDKKPTLLDIFRAAEANCRLASDQEVQNGCGCNRQKALEQIAKAKRNIDAGKPLSSSEELTLSFLGNRFIWRPAFHSRQLLKEFYEIISSNELVVESEITPQKELYPNLCMHAITTMHGSKIILSPDMSAHLLAGYANKDRYLEVKLQISFEDGAKPISVPICLFLTDLSAHEYCVSSLLLDEPNPMADDWAFPLEVTKDGRLSPMN